MALKLHIGALKTGTTTLQHYCHDHRDFLLQRGLYYPEPASPSSAAHLGRRNPDANWIQSVIMHQDPEGMREGFTYLNTCAEQGSKHPNCLISAEALSMMPMEQLEIFKDGIEFEPDEIYLGIRNIYRLALSFINMRLYASEHSNTPRLAGVLLDRVCNFAATIERFETLFPDAPIKLMVMEDALPSVAHSYLSDMGVDMTDAPPEQPRNVGIPSFVFWTAMEMGFITSAADKALLAQAVRQEGSAPDATGDMSKSLVYMLLKDRWKCVDHKLVYPYRDILLAEPAWSTGDDVALSRLTYMNAVISRFQQLKN